MGKKIKLWQYVSVTMLLTVLEAIVLLPEIFSAFVTIPTFLTVETRFFAFIAINLAEVVAGFYLTRG